ncbi:hypothetical protein EVAR_10981_1 [Eumeta japonica]|uniref:Uncharacterized protein n=1 Tax=Eumeta variegata TaxID=151549 RepID=A0A4C1U608_EUMVA|nr:hypothetical protein EVAR_10981_1 [Eumeta japonica]
MTSQEQSDGRHTPRNQEKSGNTSPSGAGNGRCCTICLATEFIELTLSRSARARGGAAAAAVSRASAPLNSFCSCRDHAFAEGCPLYPVYSPQVVVCTMRRRVAMRKRLCDSLLTQFDGADYYDQHSPTSENDQDSWKVVQDRTVTRSSTLLERLAARGLATDTRLALPATGCARYRELCYRAAQALSGFEEAAATTTSVCECFNCAARRAPHQ